MTQKCETKEEDKFIPVADWCLTLEEEDKISCIEHAEIQRIQSNTKPTLVAQKNGQTF